MIVTENLVRSVALKSVGTKCSEGVGGGELRGYDQATNLTSTKPTPNKQIIISAKKYKIP
jgi:hypothetical protein